MKSQPDIQLATDLRTVSARLIKKLRKQSVTGQQLSLTERSSLSLLQQHKELLPSELAAMEKITNQSMSQILSHLLELGYISRKDSETDKRKVIISLTPAGEKTLIRVRAERDEWLLKAIAETCSAAEVEILQRAIAPLTKLVDFE
ncbi:MAG TPA: MarR family transcriptional regulator [Mucilaginibacter sp.]|jgi:DNA-binding MarR family transcriptional regulator|nr:MarR family transcriptional regulator [Mucilaginibacter sp.]